MSRKDAQLLSEEQKVNLLSNGLQRAFRPSRVVKVQAAEGAGASINDTPKVTQARLVLYIVAW